MLRVVRAMEGELGGLGPPRASVNAWRAVGVVHVGGKLDHAGSALQSNGNDLRIVQLNGAVWHGAAYGRSQGLLHPLLHRAEWSQKSEEN